MNIDTFIALIRAQMPDASEEVVKEVAQKALDEATREADRRATEATKSAVANYEKKHGLKDGKPEGTPNDTPKPDNPDEAPAWAKALIEESKSMKAELDVLKKEKTVTSRKTAFEGLIAGLPDSIKAAYLRTPYADLSDEDFGTLTDKIGKEVEGILAEQKTRGITTNPRNPQPNPTDSKASKEEVDAILASSPNFGKL